MHSDDIRFSVLEYFFHLYQKNPLSWRVASSIAKALPELAKTDVYAAAEFLADEKYLKREKRERGRERYKISTKGLQEFSPSRFKTQPLSPVSLNTKGGIFVFGNNLGTIKQETVLSFEEINQLVKLIQQSELSELQKRNLIGDAETVRAQLTKPKPDKTILQKAWNALQEVSSLNDTFDLLQTIGNVINTYMHLGK